MVETTLRRCEALVKYHLEVAVFENPDLAQHHSRTGAVNLPNLETLSLHNCGIDLAEFFELLYTPRVGYLQYHSSSSARPSDLPYLVHRVSNTLEILVTDSELYSREDFTQYLRYCPHLKYLIDEPDYPCSSSNVILTIGETSHRYDDEFFKTLTTLAPEDIGRGFPLPELEVIENDVPVFVTEDDLIKFISMRQGSTIPGVSKVKRFAMVLRQCQLKPILEAIEPFVKDGLDVSLHFPPSYFEGEVSPYNGLDSPDTRSLSAEGSPTF